MEANKANRLKNNSANIGQNYLCIHVHKKITFCCLNNNVEEETEKTETGNYIILQTRAKTPNRLNIE